MRLIISVSQLGLRWSPFPGTLLASLCLALGSAMARAWIQPSSVSMKPLLGASPVSHRSSKVPDAPGGDGQSRGALPVQTSMITTVQKRPEGKEVGHPREADDTAFQAQRSLLAN